MPTSHERLVRNQVLFREVNERLEKFADGTGVTEFLCECSDPDCIGTIELHLGEYEGVRSRSTLFVVLPGHQSPEVERVDDENDRFVLVEKMVRRDLAVDGDPRGRGETSGDAHG